MIRKRRLQSYRWMCSYSKQLFAIKLTVLNEKMVHQLKSPTKEQNKIKKDIQPPLKTTQTGVEKSWRLWLSLYDYISICKGALCDNLQQITCMNHFFLLALRERIVIWHPSLRTICISCYTTVFQHNSEVPQSLCKCLLKWNTSHYSVIC